MKTKIDAKIFETFNKELEKIENEYNDINSQIDEDNWDYYATVHPDIFDDVNQSFINFNKKLIVYLNGSYKIKINRINSYQENYIPIIKTILRDMYFKYNNSKNSENTIEIFKLLEARENNIDFEDELAEMITGDNNNFPYRSSTNITKFFQDLGFDFTHDGTTRKIWVKEVLEKLNIKDIHKILSNGLFNKKYYKKHVDKFNSKVYSDNDGRITYEMLINLDVFFNNALAEFEIFIKDSIDANKPFNLSTVLDMNVNMELLFDNKANTSDDNLNKLIGEAKERFISNDKQIGVEKLWDAFERMKTFFAQSKKEKIKSITKIVGLISQDFDEVFIDEEFKKLTYIGNNYRIRHHETNTKELTDTHKKYFFFRMLSLIDLCLVYLNKVEDNNDA